MSRDKKRRTLFFRHHRYTRNYLLISNRRSIGTQRNLRRLRRHTRNTIRLTTTIPRLRSLMIITTFNRNLTRTQGPIPTKRQVQIKRRRSTNTLNLTSRIANIRRANTMIIKNSNTNSGLQIIRLKISRSSQRPLFPHLFRHEHRTRVVRQIRSRRLGTLVRRVLSLLVLPLLVLPQITRRRRVTITLSLRLSLVISNLVGQIARNHVHHPSRPHVDQRARHISGPSLRPSTR